MEEEKVAEDQKEKEEVSEEAGPWLSQWRFGLDVANATRGAAGC